MPRKEGLKETEFLDALRSRSSFFKKRMYHLCLLLLKKKKKAAGKKKKMGGTENSALGPFPFLFPSLGRRIQEKGFAFLGERY